MEYNEEGAADLNGMENPQATYDGYENTQPNDFSNNYDPGMEMQAVGNPYDYTAYEGEGAMPGDNEMSIEPRMAERDVGDYFGNSSEVIEKLEQTLAVIKPEAMQHSDEIITLIRREGLAVLKVRRVQLTAEQASQFFQDMYETPGFSEAVSHLYSGPILAMVLSGPAAIIHWNNLIGPPGYQDRSEKPTCFRARFGTPDSDVKNGLHGSASEADALRELHFFFPELVVEPIIADNLASYYLNENVHPVLTIGLSKLVRERPDDPVMWLADWLLANNPNKPKEFGRNGCQ